MDLAAVAMVAAVLVALLADSHFNEGSRFEECCRLHDWISRDAEARGVSLIVHGGDLYDRRSTPREREAVADWVCRLPAPSVFVRGNHDQPGELSMLSRLKARHDVYTAERPTSEAVAGVQVACLPWPTQRQGEEERLDALRSVARELGGGGPRLLVGHAGVAGAVTGAGQPLVGLAHEYQPSDFAGLGLELVALGHIHQHQSWFMLPQDPPIVYPGAPRHTDWGVRHEVGYVVVRFHANGAVAWQFVPVPATPMIAHEMRWTKSWFDSVPPDVRGAELRLRYSVRAEHRAAARASAESMHQECLDDGAVSVLLEEVVEPESEARAPEVATATTLEAKLAALWRARGYDPGERMGELLRKLGDLEEEAAP